MNDDIIQIGPGMPDNLEDMTLKQVKEFLAKQQEVIDLKKRAIAEICWNEIGEVCKKHNCMIKPVVKLNEMQDGQYTFYADLAVVAMELSDEQSSGEDKSDDKESSAESDATGQTGKRESDGKENDEVRETE